MVRGKLVPSAHTPLPAEWRDPDLPGGVRNTESWGVTHTRERNKHTLGGNGKAPSTGEAGTLRESVPGQGTGVGGRAGTKGLPPSNRLHQQHLE